MEKEAETISSTSRVHVNPSQISSNNDRNSANKEEDKEHGRAKPFSKSTAKAKDGLERITLKVLIIGGMAVGRTNFATKYVQDKFEIKTLPTIGGVDRLCKADWIQMYSRGAHGCLVMCDLTVQASLGAAVRWKNVLDESCTQRQDPLIPCLLVANKCDLVEHRDVSQEELEDLCLKNNFLGWRETSAKEGTMIQESMDLLIQHMLASSSVKLERKDQDTKSGKCSLC